MTVQFTATPEERCKMREIVQRVVHENPRVHQCLMSLEACHCSDVPLDLDAMLSGPLLQVSHDVHAIDCYISKITGKLRDGFRPRFALKAKTSEK